MPVLFNRVNSTTLNEALWSGQSLTVEVLIIKKSSYKNTRGSDSYAFPDPSKRNRTNQQTFLHAKEYSKLEQFSGKQMT